MARAALIIAGLLFGLVGIGLPAATASGDEQSNRVFGTLRNSAADNAPV
jgi:hypothetical protein